MIRKNWIYVIWKNRLGLSTKIFRGFWDISTEDRNKYLRDRNRNLDANPSCRVFSVNYIWQSCSVASFAHVVQMCYERQKGHNLLLWMTLWTTLWPFSMNYERQKVLIKELWTSKGHNQGIMNIKRSQFSVMNNIVNDKKDHNIVNDSFAH